MSNDSLHDRGKSMEDAFFREQDRQLLENLKDEMSSGDDRAGLEKASGISDPATLDAFLANKVTPESITAISLVPLLSVAWADGKMEDNEAAAILKAAGEAGVAEGTAAFGLLKSWLIDKPGDDLLEAWKSYVGSLKSSLEPAPFAQLRNSVMERAEGVAKAAGGFLGLATISDAEAAVIDDLRKVFG